MTPLFPDLEIEVDDNAAATAEALVTVAPQGGYLAKTPACKVHNDNDPTIDPSLKDELPTAVLKRMEEGNLFETHVGEQFRNGGLSARSAVFLAYSHADLDDATRVAWENATIAAMDSGARFIWNARLPRIAATHQTGEPDFMVRVGDRRNQHGKWAYRPGDVKDHRSLTPAKTVTPYRLGSYAAPRLEEAVESDALGGGKAQLRDLMQLSHYVAMLDHLGYGPDAGAPLYGAVLGREEVVLWVDLDARNYRHLDYSTGERRMMSPREIQTQEFAHRLRVVRRAMARGVDVTLDPLAGPERKAECLECVWRTACHDELVDSDHVTLVGGITPDRAQVHYLLGTTTISQLAALDWASAVLIDAGLDVRELIAEAKLLDPAKNSTRALGTEKAVFKQAGVRTNADIANLDEHTAQYSGMGAWHLAESIDQARVMKAQRVFRARGVEHVDMAQAAVEFDVDMENGADGLIYLWGVKVTRRSRGQVSTEYRPFCDFSGTLEGEAKAFAEFWGFMKETQTRTREQHLGGFKAFCYSGAENRCMRALAKRHQGVEGIPSTEEVEAFIASDDWVDLLDVLSVNTIWPTETMGLKDVAKYVKFAWRDDDANGGASIGWYELALNGADEATREGAIARVLDYNEDDVTATYVLREWLRRLGEARRPGRKLPAVSELDRRFRRARRSVVVTQTITRRRKEQ